MVCHAPDEDWQVDLLILGSGRKDAIHPFSDPSALAADVDTTAGSTSQDYGMRRHMVDFNVGRRIG
jgi:hypothetical protein